MGKEEATLMVHLNVRVWGKRALKVIIGNRSCNEILMGNMILMIVLKFS